MRLPCWGRLGGQGSGRESGVCSEHSLLSLVPRQVLQPPGPWTGLCVLWLQIAEQDSSPGSMESRGDGTHSVSQLLGSWGLVARAHVVQVWTLCVMIRGEEKHGHSLEEGRGEGTCTPALDAQERGAGAGPPTG